MSYLLDADVFIQAKNLHYGFDVCPGFWSWLDQERAAGLVTSTEQVGMELRAGQDNLSAWAHARPGLFPQPDAATIACLPAVSIWANGGAFGQAAVSTFLQAADFYLVAEALAHQHILVTHEKVSNGTKRIKIPNACVELGAQCITPFEMLRRTGARFVLAP
jgi:hypothetical protein